MPLSHAAPPRTGDGLEMMIGLDTNMVVRYLTHDDASQTAAAVKVIDSLSQDSPGFLSQIVIAELVWALEVCYRFNKNEVESVLDTLLQQRTRG